MRYSLNDNQPKNPVSADVAIVGAGLAGLVLANSLAKQGLTIIVLESGSVRQVDDIHPLNKVEQVSQEYLGATEGRFRGLGGTSTRWGGALLPYLPFDLSPHPCGWHGGWGLAPEELNKHLIAIEEDFGVSPGTYEGTDALHFLPSFQPRFPKWPAFKNRSAAHIYREQIQNDPRVTIWTDATVTEFLLGESRIAGLVARNSSGASFSIKSKNVAIAAGAIETTRLLLLFNRANDGKIFPKESPLGKGFHDHLSAPVAKLETRSNAAITRLFGFRFGPGGMRNLRFELGAEARASQSLPAAFLHVAFTRENNSGFDGLRRVYLAAQNGVLPALADLVDIARDLPWFMRAAWWRLVNQRVLPPPQSDFELHLVTEQQPRSENQIGLSESLVDRFGLPLARIDWRVHSEDIAHFQLISALAIKEWAEGPLAEFGNLVLRDKATIEAELKGCGGIYHPAGTTRIGFTAAEGVVDSQLRVHGVPGLWAIATSAFPSVGGTSPSLGLMQFAANTAQVISEEVRKGT